MAVRRRRVLPDQIQYVDDGNGGYREVPVVANETVVNAVLEAVSVGQMTGGIVTIVWGREKTGLPGEAVTTGLVIEHKDVPRAKLKPEVDVDVVGAVPLPDPEPETAPEPEPVAEDPEPEIEEDTSSMVLHAP